MIRRSLRYVIPLSLLMCSLAASGQDREYSSRDYDRRDYDRRDDSSYRSESSGRADRGPPVELPPPSKPIGQIMLEAYNEAKAESAAREAEAQRAIRDGIREGEARRLRKEQAEREEAARHQAQIHEAQRSEEERRQQSHQLQQQAEQQEAERRQASLNEARRLEAAQRQERRQREQREREAASMARNGSDSQFSRGPVDPSTYSPSGSTSNCATVDAPPKGAVGWSRVSEADARSIALSQAKGCKLVSEMWCDSSYDPVVEDGKIRKGAAKWDCRVSYHCGETRQQCETRPAGASRQ